MIGDDIESDMLAAQRAGVTGVLEDREVLPETHRAAGGAPDHVIESFADFSGAAAGAGRLIARGLPA
jgi:FMN phosphatase YigB (HAD superfamily)